MAEEEIPGGFRRFCFATIGATAPFNALITAVLRQDFLKALSQARYTHLVVQHGSGGQALFEQFMQQTERKEKSNDDDAADVPSRFGLTITGFDYKSKGLTEEMLAAKGGGYARLEGLVVSHAGTGCILESLRLEVPLIVVPNPDLLDNHQVELAEALAEQGYVVHGDLENLPAAIQQAEKMKKDRKHWPPVNSGEDPSGRGLAGVMDEEMGFLD